MKKIIIISGTNRPDSNTLKVSKIYKEILKAQDVDAEILDLTILPENIAFIGSFGKPSEEFNGLINKYISNNTYFLFVVPEYNGGFPGILKLFIDCIPPKEWMNKYALLVGVSVGRAGNLRGMDQLTGVLNYLRMHIFYNKLPISNIEKLFNANGNFNNEEQSKVCVNQVQGFLDWIKK